MGHHRKAECSTTWNYCENNEEK